MNLTKKLATVLIGTVGVNVIIGFIDPYLTLEASNIWYTIIGMFYIVLGTWLPIRILNDK